MSGTSPFSFPNPSSSAAAATATATSGCPFGSSAPSSTATIAEFSLGSSTSSAKPRSSSSTQSTSPFYSAPATGYCFGPSPFAASSAKPSSSSSAQSTSPFCSTPAAGFCFGPSPFSTSSANPSSSLSARSTSHFSSVPAAGFSFGSSPFSTSSAKPSSSFSARSTSPFYAGFTFGPSPFSTSSAKPSSSSSAQSTSRLSSSTNVVGTSDQCVVSFPEEGVRGEGEEELSLMSEAQISALIEGRDCALAEYHNAPVAKWAVSILEDLEKRYGSFDMRSPIALPSLLRVFFETLAEVSWLLEGVPFALFTSDRFRFVQRAIDDLLVARFDIPWLINRWEHLQEFWRSRSLLEQLKNCEDEVANARATLKQKEEKLDEVRARIGDRVLQGHQEGAYDKPLHHKPLD